MDRRKFIKNISYTSAGAIVLGGVPLNVLAGNKALKLAAATGNTDNVLVFIQLHGGNDALNTVIPVSQYNNYYNLRPNIAIPGNGTRRYLNVDTSIDENMQVGLHPDMLAMKQMYDEGKVAIIQNVGYPDMNLSHFRGRDIVFMGSDSYGTYNSGWMGRYLNFEYPGYPDSFPSTAMPDPIGIEFSGNQSIAFHRENGIPIGLSIGSPEEFYNLINSVGVEAPIAFPDTHSGDEIRYIMEFENKSNQYKDRLKEVFDAGHNSSVEYPDAYPFAAPEGSIHNPLSGQLRLIARLLSGGINTRIFLVRIGGFDTHAQQVEKGDPTLGTHAALLYHLSTAVKAFYDDLNQLGLDQKVLSMTFTEFGRRALSNASYGTDHGTSTPVILFGTGINNGVFGVNPDLTDLDNGNLKYNIDYRQIYTSVVQDWFGASDEAMAETGFSDWVGRRLPLITTGIDERPYRENGPKLSLFPNPAGKEVNTSFFMKANGDYTLYIYNTEGKVVLSKKGFGSYGLNNLQLNINELLAGKYVLRVQPGSEVLTGEFIKLTD